MSSSQDVTDLKMAHIKSLIDQIKSAIPSLEEMIEWKDVEELTSKIRKQNDRIMKLVYVAYAEMAIAFLILILGG